MQQGQKFLFWLFVLVVLVVLVGCAPSYTVSQYNGISHDEGGKVWLTGSTTRYANGTPISTSTWVQVCTQDPATTVPKLLCQRVQLVEGVVGKVTAPAPSAVERDDGSEEDEEDGEEEEEDKPAPKPKPQGHPLDPKNQAPADDDR